jgi:hypothetical protein
MKKYERFTNLSRLTATWESLYQKGFRVRLTMYKEHNQKLFFPKTLELGRFIYLSCEHFITFIVLPSIYVNSHLQTHNPRRSVVNDALALPHVQYIRRHDQPKKTPTAESKSSYPIISFNDILRPKKRIIRS